jgi:uncharacterized membrane protein HdeD (DUF308 family)
MSTTSDRIWIEGLRHDLGALRSNWLWFVLLGVALIIVGFIALGALGIATLATALVLGALLLVSGVFETVGAFWSRGWSGFFLSLLSGVLSVIVGLMFLRAPLDAVVVLTLLLACLLLVSGLFRIIAALIHRFPTWGWSLASGAIDLLLGLLIWQGWPESALWVLGLFMGISMVFRGVNWIALGMTLRNLPQSSAG